MADLKIADLVEPVKKAHGLHYKNPSVPVTAKLPDEMEYGTKIYFHGCVTAEPKRFEFNLLNEKNDSKKSGPAYKNFFHFNPRFDDKCVVRNSRVESEKWKTAAEEREGGMPFTPEQPFLITIIPTKEHYEVEVNGKPFITYKYRDGFPFSEVTHIEIRGHVTVYGIHVPLDNLPVPLSLDMPQKLSQGDSMAFCGTVQVNASNFEFDIKSGVEEEADIVYQFKADIPKEEIMCNTRISNEWGIPEVYKNSPIRPGADVTVNIVAGSEGFMTFVNENKEPLPTFKHRVDVNDATAVVVEGDIKIQSVTTDQPPLQLPAQVPDVDTDIADDKVAQPDDKIAQPDSIIAQPDDKIAQPDDKIAQPGDKIAQPDVKIAQPDDKVVQPDDKIAQADRKITQAVQVPTPVDIPLPEELGPGQGVYLDGKVPDDSKGFQINLTGKDSNSDVPVQLQSSFDQTPVLNVNSRTGGKWKNELQTTSPIAPGSDVQVFIVCEDVEYVCRVNGDVVGRIPRNMNSGKVTHVCVDGCINVQRLCGIC